MTTLSGCCSRISSKALHRPPLALALTGLCPGRTTGPAHPSGDKPKAASLFWPSLPPGIKTGGYGFNLIKNSIWRKGHQVNRVSQAPGFAFPCNPTIPPSSSNPGVGFSLGPNGLHQLVC